MLNRTYKKFLLLTLLLASSVQAGDLCREGLLLIDKGNFDGFVEWLRGNIAHLDPAARTSLFSTYFHSGHPDAGNSFALIMDTIGRDIVEEVIAAGNRAQSISAATRGGQHRPFLQNVDQLNQAGSPQNFSFTLLLTHSGARALAYRALRNAPAFLVAMEKVKKGLKDSDGNYGGLTWHAVELAYQNAARDPALVTRARRDDNLFRSIFASSVPRQLNLDIFGSCRQLKTDNC